MNIVYIDAQNTHKATCKLGRQVDRKRFFVYLKNKYKADIIYYAIGYVSEYQGLYSELEKIGYIMLYKKTIKLPDGTIKGNVDIDIAIRAVFDICENSLLKAYLITNDGDYNTLVDVFKYRGVFGSLIAPDYNTTSKLLKQAAGSLVQDMQRLKHLINNKRPKRLA